MLKHIELFNYLITGYYSMVLFCSVSWIKYEALSNAHQNQPDSGLKRT